MRLVTKAHVEFFRSIRRAELADISDFSVLAGLNNSGKSNFLRALSAFFTGEVEPGVPLKVDADYFRHDISSKKKKTIRVQLTFSLPPEFKFRAGLKEAETLLGRQFTLAKAWTRGVARPDVFLNGSPKPLGTEDRELAEAFLGLIAFRYIPNRVIPTELIRREQEALRDVLIRRLARFKKQSEAVFGGIQETAGTLIAKLQKDVTRIAPDVSAVRLATATSLADLAFKFGYRLREQGAEMEESEQGSGVQSLLLLQTLHLIDRDYFQQFGWKQAALWAVEEPESSLHAALEAQVAVFLSSMSKESGGRFQAIATTHSDLMMQYATNGYIVEKGTDPVTKQPGTTAALRTPYALVEESARFGISKWVNPILYYPLETLVLVEGKYDRDFIIAAAAALRPGMRVRIVCMEDLSAGERDKGGTDTLLRFIRSQSKAIKVRSRTAPVVVVLDWDAASKRTEFERPFSAGDPFRVLAWNEKQANPKLDRSFRGIERFFSDRIISEACAGDPALIGEKRNGTFCVAGDYGVLKRAAWNVVRQGLLQEDLVHSRQLIDELVLATGGKPSPTLGKSASALAVQPPPEVAGT